ncbi:transcriptional regulator containing an amidase domain and an AraC-type DNA-binding HTH domain [Desulfosporosinus orientis DSM 765]|uniref:Transcriptional regulator containing an amidase domain and an AraC-type DNA-binding HTH domain n=1 Tax=Desulfosporosinus orientis (strain ATCC 19365 / DSM 765 / NCIMB 8382 / VKM B-1628 / Singapore I) TaxID=768706 RepID=G7W927_DESOD|nr:AraC family transcriptional regulator [Desulfosporosinus orientis]AET68236.1 transcriptional regulator containing an amidase domain and an AraC-type DNA-binding HTH domain [Desulfosporosinus orientis DSM 765]
MENESNNQHTRIINSFHSVFGSEKLLAQVIDFFPYSIQVYSPDGTSVLVNQALLKEYHIPSPDMIVGKYNIFKDPAIAGTNLIHSVKRAFQGETIFLTDIKVPFEDITQRYGINDLDIEALYQDITIFPILNSENQISYIVALLINRRVYQGKNEIIRAKEYIESHWLDTFVAGEVAKAAGLSKTHFTRLFKKHTGMTPHDYYTNYKINKLKEKLSDFNLSVAQAFAICGLDYNGHFARVFKEKVGLSPAQYRNTVNS